MVYWKRCGHTTLLTTAGFREKPINGYCIGPCGRQSVGSQGRSYGYRKRFLVAQDTKKPFRRGGAPFMVGVYLTLSRS